MHIGIIKFKIQLPANQSLKGKRKIVSSLIRKLHNNFAISVAETANNDDLKTAVIGISFVSNDIHILHRLISQILSYLQEHAGDYVLLDFNQDILSGY
jgi:uncharacterized protein